MAIAHVQSRGNYADNATSISLAFTGNVTAGNLLIIMADKYSPSNDAFAAADCTKSAGTATIGTITLDVSQNVNASGSDYMANGIWSVPVTGSGSCTIQVAGGVAGSYWIIGIVEVSGADTGASRLEDSSTGTANSSAVSSGDGTSAGGAIFVGIHGVYTGSTRTITPDAAFSAIYEQEDVAHNIGAAEYRIVTTGTTDSASWSLDSGHLWMAAVVVYKESGAAVTYAPPPARQVRMPDAILAR